MEEDGDFYVLTLTARCARFYEASRYHLAEQKDADFPVRIRELPKEISDPAHEPSIEVARERADPVENRKSDFYDYFAHVADVVARRINTESRPLVVVAIEELRGQFLDRAQPRNISSLDVEKNPESLGETELRDRAYERVLPYFVVKQSQALQRFESVFGKGQPRASIDLAEVLNAARDGRVDTLFVADDTHVWGNLDPAADGFHPHDEPSAGDEELLDFVAAETLRNGGAVHVLPRSETPFGKPVAALFRY